jgi:hypothetical protein
MRLRKEAVMQRRSVTLSDGTTTTMVIDVHGRDVYYPDTPHCYVCDRSQRDTTLVLCDATVRGKRTGCCGRYVCRVHRIRLGTRDLCPGHAVATPRHKEQ